jgi:hypothetical protein
VQITTHKAKRWTLWSREGKSRRDAWTGGPVKDGAVGRGRWPRVTAPVAWRSDSKKKTNAGLKIALAASRCSSRLLTATSPAPRPSPPQSKCSFGAESRLPAAYEYPCAKDAGAAMLTSRPAALPAPACPPHARTPAAPRRC